MPISSISLKRSVTSYAKVQAWIGWAIRNRRFQLQRRRIAGIRYLDIGCGQCTHKNLINLDFLWHPKIDVCWDIRRGLPFRDQSLRGVFSEHCLEHFALPEALSLLREIRRVLQPSGAIRIVVPDGELYLRTYVSQISGDAGRRFPFQDAESLDALWTPMTSVNRVFYQDRESLFGHRTIYDYPMLAAVLRHCGFGDIQKCEFRRGRDEQILIDNPARRIESLYVEATVS